MEFTRRTLFRVGGATLVGRAALAQDLPKPAMPRLVAGERSRGADYLDIVFDAVAGADRHELIFRTGSGETRMVPEPGQRYAGLDTNRTIEIRVQAFRAATASPVSDPLRTATRPLAPPDAPGIGLAWNGTAMGLALVWTLDGLPGTANPESPLKVLIGAAQGEAEPSIQPGDWPLSGRYTLDGARLVERYSLALASANDAVPGGVNRSAWGPSVQPVQYATTITAAVSRDASGVSRIDTLRFYYAHT